jgi:trans-2-enoyl-CoA reductase
MKTKVICFHETGIPEEAARLEEWDLPALKPNQVLVKMKAATLNPADINILEGKYGVRPELPAVPGNEGAGVIAELGPAVSDFKKGDLVIAPGRIGSWCEAFVIEADKLVVFPPEISAEQAAMMSINAPTAWRLLEDFGELQTGDWLIQNAANSNVGRFVIEIAKARGLKTVNVVRRKELILELKALGADVVVTEEPPLSKQIKELTKGAKILLGLNAVGGESAREIAKSLSPHGTLVTYGAMGREPLQISNALLIFKDIRFCGIWINEWFRTADKKQIQGTFDHLIALAKAGKLKAPVEKTYPLADYKKAIQHAQQSSRKGKILFVMNG